MTSRITRRVLTTAGLAAFATSAHAQSLLDFVKASQDGQGRPNTPQPAHNDASANSTGRKGLEPKGYSFRFLPVRQLISDGRYDDAYKLYVPPEQPVVTPPPPSNGDAHPAKPAALVEAPFLRSVEAGLLAFELGRHDLATDHFKAAEEVAPPTSQAPKKSGGGFFGQIGKFGTSIVGKATGNEEIGEYRRFDHETILALNYLSLSHLMQGRRASYNVARRCIAEQQELRAKFEKQLQDYKAQNSQPNKDKPEVNEAERSSFDSISKEFSAYDSIANRAPNAYVNPLGDYICGMVQEVASVEQPPLRDNSRISYQNALTLSGSSAQLASAVKAMSRPRAPANERIVHVIVAEGFAPSRQVMSYGVAINNQVAIVHFPLFVPTPSAVNSVEAQFDGATSPVHLDAIGDFEAIMMRDQHDRLPMVLFSTIGTMIVSLYESQLASKAGIFGTVLYGLKEANASPDTRSWLSLPRRFHVARCVVPAKSKRMELRTMAASGVLHRQTVDLAPDLSHSVVYARATDIGLRAAGARKLWVDGRLEDVA